MCGNSLAFCDSQRLGVHNHVRSEFAQQLERFLDPGRGVHIADGNRMLELIVITLGVENAEFELPLDHALGERRGQCRFPDARAAGNEHAARIGLEINLPLVAVDAEADAVPMRRGKVGILPAYSVN